MTQKRDHKQDEKDIEDDLGDTSGCHGDSAKPQNRSYQRDYEKSESPSKHYDLQRRLFAVAAETLYSHFPAAALWIPPWRRFLPYRADLKAL
jgi:hypothetical protein